MMNLSSAPDWPDAGKAGRFKVNEARFQTHNKHNQTTTMTITHRSDIPLSGFAGIREYRMHFAQSLDEALMGSFIYLADATFIPNGETRMHPHRDVDIVSVMLKGRVEHRGTLGNGTILQENTIQVQRAGTGMEHNEVNPDPETNRMIQIWFLPPRQGLEPGYQTFEVKKGEMASVLGGDDTFDNAAHLQIARVDAGGRLVVDEPCVVYVATGKGHVEESEIIEGDLIKAPSIALDAVDEMEAIVITLSP